MDEKHLLLIAIKAAWYAGIEILKIYDTDFAVEEKNDKSPLTLADQRSHDLIYSCLDETTLPLLSEEGKYSSYRERKNWHKFWLVDPLDGTKEFIKKNGEFTVNIALIRNNEPIAGVVHVPVKQCMYFACEGLGSFKAEECDVLFNEQENESDFLQRLIDNSQHLTSSSKENGDSITIISSRSHITPETEDYIHKIENKYSSIKTITAGSSLKLCLVAEDKADCYPRFGPTMEWDTAAGHAIVKYSGGRVLQYPLGNDLIYNKENTLNPHFLVLKNMDLFV